MSSAPRPWPFGGRLRAFAAWGEALRVRPGEGRRTALLFFHLLLASAVFVLGRTVRDTLFLSRYALSALPWMFVLYGVASAITALVYTRAAAAMARERAIVWWCAVGIVSYLATWVAVRAGAVWIYPVFYVWSEVVANLAISQFWTLANDLHDARSAKRLFGTIGAARVLGVVLVGLATGAVVRLLGTAQLLFVLAAMLAGIAFIARLLGREPHIRFAAHAGESPRRARPVRYAVTLRDRYVQVLALMLLFGFAALTIGDYQWKAIARATYREDDLATFFSFFYALTGVVAFLFQIFLTPRLLGRLGVGAGLSVMPAVFGVASVLLLPFTAIPLATVMKFADNGFQYTVHETTLQVLYVPFAAQVKVRTRALLDVLVKPLAYALGGVLVLVFATPLGTRWLGVVALVCVVAWVLVIPSVRRHYLAKLEATLSAAGMAALGAGTTIDAAGQKMLVQALAARDPRVVLAALDEIEAIARPDVLAALERLLAHESPAVRVAALDRLARSAHEAGAPEHEAGARNAVKSALVDGVPEVRAAAATAYAALVGDDAIDALTPLLDDEGRAVRAAALSGVLAHGGFEGAMLGGTRLKALLASADRKDRMDAASVLAALGRQGRRRLEHLLADPDPEVRLEAVRAASSVADQALVPQLLRALGERRLAPAAATALAAVGPPAVPALRALLDDPETAREVRLGLPRVLRSIVCEESYAAVRAVTASEDSHLRLRAFAALSRLRSALGRPPEPLGAVRGWLEREIVETYHNLCAWERARPEFHNQLLEEAVDFRRVRGVRRVLRILELRCEPEPLWLVRERIEDPERRPNALEVLDTEVGAALRPLVMPFFDDLPVAEKAHRLGLPPPPEPAEFMRAQCRHPNPFVALVALEALGQKRHALCAEEGRRALAHREPMVREAGLRALCALPAPDAAEAVMRCRSDPDASVAALAGALAARLGAGPVRVGSATEPPREVTEIVMYSTVEKLLLLRTAPVFAKLRSEDLAPLARIAEAQRYEPREPVFVEGEMGDALFVLVRGTVTISHGGERLATLGPGEAFGEMAVLDAAPRSASATAAEEVEVLRIGSEAFYEVLHEHAEIAEGVIRMLSQRLREANTAHETRPAPAATKGAPGTAPPAHDAEAEAERALPGATLVQGTPAPVAGTVALALGEAPAPPSKG